MSEEKMEETKKLLSKEFLLKQVADGQAFIEQANKQVLTLQTQIQRQIGTINLAQTILKTFDISVEGKAEPGK